VSEKEIPMGMFRVEVEAVGNHGCQREKQEGETVEGCGDENCTDCITREYIAKLKAKASVSKATITHWPTDPEPHIVDDLLTKTRSKPFGKPFVVG
jgi:hypothetical protein